MTDDALTYRARHPEHTHSRVPWTSEQSARLLDVWRELLESQNGEGVDGSELPADGKTIGWLLREFVDPRERVLIIGAGRGQEVVFARDRGFNADGITLGAMNVAIARQSFGLSLAFTDAHCTTLPPASYDVIIALQVLEHSPAPLILLLECARLLRAGGRAFFETPPPALHTGGRSLHHVLCPTPRQARGLLEKSGFDDVQQWVRQTPLDAKDQDRGDLRDDLMTAGRRMSLAESFVLDPATRRILGEAR